MLPLEATTEQLAGIEEDLHLFLAQPSAPGSRAHHNSLLEGWVAAWGLRVSGVAAHFGKELYVGEFVFARGAAEEVARLFLDPKVLLLLLLLLLLFFFLRGLFLLLLLAEAVELELHLRLAPVF